MERGIVAPSVEIQGPGAGQSHSQTQTQSPDRRSRLEQHEAPRNNHRERSSSSLSEVEGELSEIDLSLKKKHKVMMSRQSDEYGVYSSGDDLSPEWPLAPQRPALMRTRSLYGASPSCKFGPKASIMQNQVSVLTIQDPGSQRLTWYKPPLTVLIIKKILDDLVIPPFIDMVTWLVQERNMLVFVEAKTLAETQLQRSDAFTQIKSKLRTFKEGKDDLKDKVDFIICLGGDGTLLYASSLFQESVPPVMAFHLGSLGFLGPFDISDFRDKVTQVLEGNAALTLRTRLKCIVNKGGICVPPRGSFAPPRQDGNKFDACSIKHVESKQHILVLNEVVVDRGPSPYICNVDLYIEHRYITSVQGDGLIISTPTGSTAYAAAAGASMIHPNVPAILIAPVCPHSLSFRPIVVPAGVEVKIMVSPEARGGMWVSFDGRKRQELLKGDVLRISTSIYPVPSICSQDQIADWFEALAGCLHWNVRKQQRALLDSDESPDSPTENNSESNGQESNGQD